MLALARKYRPRNFASVAVQTHVSSTLKGAIARGRVAHGYLLCGPRGVGKTTLARVLAMALNCERRLSDESGAGEPCGECESCRRIWSGASSLDVVEIDAASNRGVDDARELRERALYAPSGDERYKVYIVDEAHMLTREAWNALLKILEEPPPRVVFVFATTEPQKIAQTAAPVLSRLQRFDLKRIGAAEIRTRLADVLAQEAITVESDALALIARAADGSMRDALSLTDQALSLGDGTLTEERVRESLGLVAEDEYIAILDLIAERRAGDVFAAVGRLVELGVDLGSFVTGLADILRAQLAITLGATELELSERARRALAERTNRLSAGDLLRMLHALGELEPRFRKSAQQQLLLETLLVRFALLDRSVDIEAVLRGLVDGGGSGGPSGGSGGGGASGGGSSGGSGGGGGASSDWRTVLGGQRGGGPASPPRGASPPDVGGAGAQATAAASVSSEPPPRAERVVSATRDVVRGDAPPPSGGAPALAAAAPRATGTPVAPPPARPAPTGGARPVDLNALTERWDEVIAQVRAGNRLVLASTLERVMPTAVSSGGAVTLELEDASAEPLLDSGAPDVLAALRTLFAGVERIVIARGNGAAAPPQRLTHEIVRDERVASLRKRDPVLGAAIDELDLELLD